MEPLLNKQRLYQIIFESDTRAGRQFDIALMLLIIASLVVVVVDSVEGLSRRLDGPLAVAEWVFTALFSLEYLARLYCAPQRLRYATSFFGVIDLLALLPTYLALFFPELHALIDIRLLRLVRVFRVLKLTQYLEEYRYLGDALVASRRKILVFLFTVCIVVLVMGTVMYVVEGPANGYTSIPTGVYWAITTMTTVGFGDITPKTELGRLIASVMMLLGWGVLAVPTGIVTAQMVNRGAAQVLATARGATRPCPACAGGVEEGDRFCRHCGLALGPRAPGSGTRPVRAEGAGRDPGATGRTGRRRG
jgi:voltage-gated potassium channel